VFDLGFSKLPFNLLHTAFNEFADSIFNVLALFFGFSDTKDLGEYSKQKTFSLSDHEGFWDQIGQNFVKNKNIVKCCPLCA
jgi:hypothetical protein